MPVVKFYDVVIKRTNLQKGETAIYEVRTKSNGALIWRAALNGTGEATISRTITGVPEGVYTISENGWDWAYENNTASQDLSVPTGDNSVTFTGSHQSPSETSKPAHIHNHDESYIINELNFPTTE